MSGRSVRTTASASSSDTAASGRQGSTPARKQPSDFQKLPMPATDVLVEQGVAQAARGVVLAQAAQKARLVEGRRRHEVGAEAAQARVADAAAPR